MKAGIPIKHDEGFSSQVVNSFRSARYWAIYDLNQRKLFVYPNPLSVVPSPSYDDMAHVLKDYDVSLVLHRDLSTHAVRRIHSVGIKTLKSDQGSVFGVLQDWHEQMHQLMAQEIYQYQPALAA